MNTKNLVLVLSGALMVACAGEKNEVQNNDGTLMAVRTSEDGQMTEVALVKGDFSSPEEAGAAIEGAQWQPIGQFTEDEELSFVDVNEQGIPLIMEDISHGDQARNWGRQTRRDQARGPQARHQKTRHNPRFRGHRGHGGKGWRPHRQTSQWKSRYRRWQRPQRRYWNYQSCNYKYIWYQGRCMLPYSHKYSRYKWQPRYGYRYSPVRQAHMNFYVRIYF